MFLEHETGKKRKLDAVGSDPAAETDEQLARRLHEELNALTRHSRRTTNAPVPTVSTQRSSSGGKGPKAAAAGGSRAAAAKGKQQQQKAPSSNAEPDADEQEETTAAKDKPRKRSMLNRELAMLVVDMVETHVKPVTGPRIKQKDEHDQHDQHDQQQQQQDDNHSAAAKHDSSSSLSEQERLAIEHLHAAGAEAKPVNKLLEAPHMAARTSDSGGAGGDSCTSGAASSGKASSSSHEQDQQTSGQQQQSSGKQQLLQRSGAATSADAAAAGRVAVAAAAPQAAVSTPAAAAAAAAAYCTGGSSSKPAKIPKLPMVQYGKKWYRAKVLKDAGAKVMLEYQGFSHEGGPFWLARDHPRIWRGSYKGKDWRYLGDGAWEPKQIKSDARPRAFRGRAHHKHGSAAAAAASDGTAGDSDAEQLQPHCKVGASAKHTLRAAATAAAAAGDGTASDRDTSSGDQEDEGPAAAAQLEPLTVDSPAVTEAKAEQQQLQQGDDDEEEHQEEQPAREQQQLLEQPQSDMKQQGQGQEQQATQQATQQQQQQPPPEELQQPQQQNQQQPKVEEQEQQVVVQEAVEQAAEQPPQPVDEQPQHSTHRRQRQSEADSEAAANMAAVQEGPAAKAPRRGAGKAAATEQTAVAAAAAKLESTSAAAAAAALGDSSSERQVGDAVGRAAATAKPEPALDKAEEAVSAAPAPAPAAVAAARPASTGRGRYSRRGGSKAAAAAAAATGEGDAVTQTAKPATGKRSRNARSRSAAAAHLQDSGLGEEQQPPQQQVNGTKELGLQIDASRAMKHSSSSEGLPISPTSPVAGGSPKASGHRRKGVPQRARLDSDDLQRPAKKGRTSSAAASSRSNGFGRSNSDAADVFEYPMLHELPELQLQPQPQLEAAGATPQQQQQAQQQQQLQEPQLHLGWKGGWKGAYKKGMWQQQGQQEQQEQASQLQQQGAHSKQQQQQPCESWGEQQQQVTAAAGPAPHEGPMHSEQQHVLGGSDPEDVEAACVLVGASMGRAHSGELFGMYDPTQQQQHSGSFGHRYSAGADDSQLSPRAYGGGGNGRQGGRRRGHNWSKPLNRPPRPPPLQAQQQGGHGHVLARRHSLTSGSSSQQQQQQQQQQGLYVAGAAAAAAAAGQGLHHAHSTSQELGSAASPCMGRQASLPELAPLHAGAQQQQQQQVKNGSCLLFNGDRESKAETLRVLLDAVGEVQASSGRPDLMYPLQYGGLPMGDSAAAAEPVRPCAAALQLPHMHMSAAAAALLAAVPSLETLQHMAAVQGQAGLLACLSGSAPSLFQ